MATAVGGVSAFATPAFGATGPTASLQNGIVTVTGTQARDVIDIAIGANQLAVDFGADGTVDAHFAMSAVQRVSVIGGSGDDGVSVIGVGVGMVPIVIDGGAGNDGIGVADQVGDGDDGAAPVTVNGDGGNDGIFVSAAAPVTVNAGAGDDRVEGGSAGVGHETISLGDGNDTFVSHLDSRLGTRSDVVNGGSGKDTMEMQGTFASESLVLSAHLGHLIATNALARISATNVEFVTWFGFGGLDESGAGDSVRVHDLSGTGVVNFAPDFSAPSDATAPNNSADQLTVDGTSGDDHIAVSSFAGEVTVSGLAASVTPVQLDAKDTLLINTQDGRDTVDSSGLQPGLVQLQVF